MAKYKIVLGDDKALIAEVNRQLQETRGYCPCALEWTPDTKCMCKLFRDQIERGEAGECHCGLYIIVNE